MEADVPLPHRIEDLKTCSEMAGGCEHITIGLKWIERSHVHCSISCLYGTLSISTIGSINFGPLTWCLVILILVVVGNLTLLCHPPFPFHLGNRFKMRSYVSQ